MTGYAGLYKENVSDLHRNALQLNTDKDIGDAHLQFTREARFAKFFPRR